jgi:nitrogen regulatory protein P-II 1
MKRVEAIISAEKVSTVNEALRNVGIGGATILDAKGRGKGEKPQVQSGRGTRGVTGSPGDGKIFVSTVNEAIDIGTRKRGPAAIT